MLFNEKIYKYKLERKNIFYGYCLKGIGIFGICGISTGITYFINDLDMNLFIDTLSNETLLISLGVVTTSIVKSSNLTSNINKKKKKLKK